MSDDRLQLESKEFDCIILGTGLTECLLSAALARSGKTVLHLDENKHYGGFSASLMLDSLNEILSSCATNLSKSDVGSVRAFEWSSATAVKAKDMLGTQSMIDVVIVNPSDEKNDLVQNASLSRRCSIDLTPKVIWSRSIVIDTLIRAGVSRYMEFKTLQHLCMHAEGEMIQVPVSKADVFKTSNISLIEKRQLMKFITTLSNPDEAEQKILAEFAERPFVDYAKQKKISEKLTNFIAYAIALEPIALGSTPLNMTTAAANAAILRFMGSVGRYGGHSPWIYPLYGVGDLCQSFCRLSAVYSTTFVLGEHATEITTVKDPNTGSLTITEIAIGETKNLTTKHLIANLDHLPELAKPINKSDERISRCVLIVDKPMKTREGTKDITMSIIPPHTFGHSHSVYVLQLDESASVVPSGKYLLHIWTHGSGNGAQHDLQPIVDSLAQVPANVPTTSSSESIDEKTAESSMPNILYCAFWSHVERKVRDDIDIPLNLTLVDEVNAEVGADSFFERAQQLFEKICPGEEFIPVVPNPDDIIWGGDEEDQPSEDIPQDVSQDIPQEVSQDISPPTDQ